MLQSTPEDLASAPVTRGPAAPSAAAGERHPKRPPRRPSRRMKQTLIGLALSVFVFLGLFPFIFVLFTSFKSDKQFFHSYFYPSLPLHPGNYAVAWNQLEPYFVTSFIVAAISVVGATGLGSAAAYVFARYKFPGRDALFVLVAVLLAVPSLTTLIPLFLLMEHLHLLNSLWVLVLPYTAGATVLATVVIRTFASELPAELFDAAQLDGANGVRMYRSIMLPLSKPIIGTIALITTISVWNDYFWPLLTITTNNLRTIPVGLTFFQGQNSTAYGPLFAGYMVASVPLLVFFALLSKSFLRGVQGGIPM